MVNTYIVIKNGVVANIILAETIDIARKVSHIDDILVENNNNTYSIGDTYTETP